MSIYGDIQEVITHLGVCLGQGSRCWSVCSPRNQTPRSWLASSADSESKRDRKAIQTKAHYLHIIGHKRGQSRNSFNFSLI